jgi:hypothetical protein
MNLLSGAALATALAAALAANAQAPASKSIQPAATQRAMEAPAAAAPAQQQETKTAKRASRRVPSTADARVCLEFPDDIQIVKCSEKYRWQQASSE